MRDVFAQARRGGFDIGLPSGKLVKAMVEVLSEMPPGTRPSKAVVVCNLGPLRRTFKSRDINAAWEAAKRQVVREHPDRFRLNGKVLRWTSATKGRMHGAEKSTPRPYSSRFANRYGEEWEFEYDPSSGEGILRGSDVDWQEYRVIGGRVPGLLLNEEEIQWLERTWKEATGGD